MQQLKCGAREALALHEIGCMAHLIVPVQQLNSCPTFYYCAATKNYCW